jgi:hypothetical protein|tara:strand:+ start:14644 stop:14952 length:309 start_codon:yes stop_codon:yes gene_type:complete
LIDRWNPLNEIESLHRLSVEILRVVPLLDRLMSSVFKKPAVVAHFLSVNAQLALRFADVSIGQRHPDSHNLFHPFQFLFLHFLQDQEAAFVWNLYLPFLRGR